MRSYLLILSFLTLLIASLCYGQDIESQGPLLVNKYLGSSDNDEMESIINTLDGLKVSFHKIKDWIKTPSGYKTKRAGLQRELLSVGERKGEYFVYIPPSYVPDKSWPMVITLHGVGGSGYESVLAWLKSSGHNNEFIFVAPTYGPGLWWKDEAERLILSVLDKIKEDYHIDTNRVYLTGFSSGGHGTWYMAMRYPWLFAAINPIAGECPIPSLLENLMHVPVCIIHGTKDTVIPVEASRDANSRLEALGYHVIYKELPEMKHRFPLAEIRNVLDWFRSNKRPPYPKKIKFSTESTKYPVSYWVEITEFSDLVGQVSGIHKDISGRLVRPEEFSGEIATVEANIKEKNNEIYLSTQGVKSLRLYLENGLVDMEKPLHIYINGKSVYYGKVDGSVRAILETVKKRNDREALFCGYLDLKVPSGG